MEIDNLQILLPFIKPESKDDFYYLQILQRKKENPQLGSNSRVIKNYYIKSQDELIKKYDEVKDLCRIFNARAMLRLNKRSFEKVGFKALENLAHTMMNKDYDKLHSSYDRAVGLGHNDPEKKWILDIDIKEEDLEFDWMYNLNEFITSCSPNEGESKTIARVLSRAGCHIITNPFNMQEFGKQYPYISVHKDNPTNLFIP